VNKRIDWWIKEADEAMGHAQRDLKLLTREEINQGYVIAIGNWNLLISTVHYLRVEVERLKARLKKFSGPRVMKDKKSRRMSAR
jgi:hypothetical protein